MGIYVVAEFDSADFADLAGGRLRDLPGVVSLKVERNRYVPDADNGGFTMPAVTPGTGSSVMGLMGFSPYYPIPFSYGYAGSTAQSEPQLRRDVHLLAEVSDDGTARQASALMRNLGGRGVRMVRS